jgi:hypothetical protein
VPRLNEPETYRTYLEKDRKFNSILYEKGALPSLRHEARVYLEAMRAITSSGGQKASGEKALSELATDLEALIALSGDPRSQNSRLLEIEKNEAALLAQLVGVPNFKPVDLRAKPSMRLKLLTLSLKSIIERDLARVLEAVPKNAPGDVSQSAVALAEKLIKISNEATALGLIHTVVEIEGLKK